ncbi:Flp family type IVb pilin [Roseibium algae]|uniref:Flp family type IVb pilin n=1 Tax=Roseibium algae TaxID=3123038 RepID=A0ABU8TNJ2_9HYPH
MQNLLSQVRSIAFDARGVVQRFAADESGSTAVEYGLMIGMITLAIMGTILAIGETIRDDVFGVLSGALSGDGSADS